MGDPPPSPEQWAIEIISRLHPDKHVRLGTRGFRWKVREFYTAVLHIGGIHDYMPTLTYDVENESVSRPQIMCRICHHEMGT